MSQIFQPRANTIAKVILLGSVLTLAGGSLVCAVAYRSSYFTRVGVPLEQPVPFSHEHHVSGLGLDCRYCHISVEQSSFAGMPSTHICMTCHSQIWTNAPLLEPIRASLRENRPLRWNRVYNLPDFVYFDHSIHVRKGIGCVECHGRIDQMPITASASSLHMRWCLDCHADPAPRIRPRETVFNMTSAKPHPAAEGGLAQLYHVQTTQLQDCSICHR